MQMYTLQCMLTHSHTGDPCAMQELTMVRGNQGGMSSKCTGSPHKGGPAKVAGEGMGGHGNRHRKGRVMWNNVTIAQLKGDRYPSSVF